MDQFLKKVIFRADFKQHNFKVLGKRYEIMDSAAKEHHFEEIQENPNKIISFIKHDPYERINFGTSYATVQVESVNVDLNEHNDSFSLVEEIINNEFNSEDIYRIGIRYFFTIEEFLPFEELIIILRKMIYLPKMIKQEKDSYLVGHIRSGVLDDDFWSVNMNYGPVRKGLKFKTFESQKIDLKEGMLFDLDLFRIYNKKDYSFKSVKIKHYLKEGYEKSGKLIQDVIEFMAMVKN
jgi:hypothetical protein